MVLHSSLAGADLHYPLGRHNGTAAVPLALEDNTNSAWLMEDVSGKDLLRIDTTTGAPYIALGNNSEMIQLRFDAPEAVGADPSAPTRGVVMYSRGIAASHGLYARSSSGSIYSLLNPNISNLVVTSAAAGDVLYHNGTNLVRLAIGTAGQVLTVNGGATAPEWAAGGGGGGDVSRFGATTDNRIARWHNTTADIQTSLVTIGDTGSISGVDDLDLDGTLTNTQAAVAGGSPNALVITGGAHTTLAASTEASDVRFNLDRSVQFTNGTVANQRAVYIQAPTYTGSAATATFTEASTVYIDDAPAAGANAAITDAYALKVAAGDVAFLGTEIVTAAAITIGPGTHLTTGGNAVCIGNGARATGTNATALGFTAFATATNTVAIGRLANASATDAVAVGGDSDATGTNSLALGDSSQAVHNDAIAIGHGATTTGTNQLVIGSSAEYIATAYIGSGVSASAPNNTIISATDESTSGAGAQMTLKSGDSAGTNQSGANLILEAGIPTGGPTPGMGNPGYTELLHHGATFGVGLRVSSNEMLTTNGTEVTILSFEVPTDSCAWAHVRILANNKTTADEYAYYTREVFLYDSGGSHTVLDRHALWSTTTAVAPADGVTVDDLGHRIGGASALQYSISVSGTTVSVRVQGEASNNWNWNVVVLWSLLDRT